MNATSKRVFDVLLATVVLIMVAPLMIFIALLVLLDSPGEVLYQQVRVGVNRRRPGGICLEGHDRRRNPASGRVFRVTKFRTMRTGAETNQAIWSTDNDPRVTRIGRLLRKTHFDELPQLVNVLLGDMSIVGPRPERPEFVRHLKDAVPNYENRLYIKPGITGLAQIHRQADNTIDDVRRKVRYDLLYMRNVGPWTDIKIVVGTVPVALGFSPGQMRRLMRDLYNDAPKATPLGAGSFRVPLAPLSLNLAVSHSLQQGQTSNHDVRIAQA